MTQISTATTTVGTQQRAEALRKAALAAGPQTQEWTTLHNLAERVEQGRL